MGLAERGPQQRGPGVDLVPVDEGVLRFRRGLDLRSKPHVPNGQPGHDLGQVADPRPWRSRLLCLDSCLLRGRRTYTSTPGGANGSTNTLTKKSRMGAGRGSWRAIGSRSIDRLACPSASDCYVVGGGRRGEFLMSPTMLELRGSAPGGLPRFAADTSGYGVPTSTLLQVGNDGQPRPHRQRLHPRDARQVAPRGRGRRSPCARTVTPKPSRASEAFHARRPIVATQRVLRRRLPGTPRSPTRCSTQARDRPRQVGCPNHRLADRARFVTSARRLRMSERRSPASWKGTLSGAGVRVDGGALVVQPFASPPCGTHALPLAPERSPRGHEHRPTGAVLRSTHARPCRPRLDPEADPILAGRPMGDPQRQPQVQTSCGATAGSVGSRGSRAQRVHELAWSVQGVRHIRGGEVRPPARRR